MKYRSKPVEIEAMRWWAFGDPELDEANAREVVEWVNANGGEASLDEIATGPLSAPPIYAPRIAVRTINGWAYAAPGHYVVMGEASWNQGPPTMRVVRDFYPCDPETFERRWVPA